MKKFMVTTDKKILLIEKKKIIDLYKEIMYDVKLT